MQQRRLARVLEAVGSQPAGSLVERLCPGAARLLDTPGIGLSVDPGNDLLQTICATDAARDGEALQADLGEGPSYTAHHAGGAVLVDDLALDVTWPGFGPAAEALGLRAVFAFPLRSGAVRIGAFTLYRDVAGELSHDEYADALVFARLAHDLLLALQQERPSGELDALFLDGSRSSMEIHQASGMVSVQLGIAVAAALAVLRAHAFAGGRSLRDVAQDVVDRKLRLEPDEPTP